MGFRLLDQSLLRFKKPLEQEVTIINKTGHILEISIVEKNEIGCQELKLIFNKREG